MIAVARDSGAGRRTFFGGQAHEGGSSRKMDRDGRILKIGFMWHGERRGRTEQDLNGGEGLDDDHGPAAFGTATKRAGLLSGGCCWFYLRL